MIAKIILIACVAFNVYEASGSFADLRHLLEIKTKTADVIIQYTKDGIEDQVLNYNIIGRIEFLSLEGLVLEYLDQPLCIGDARFLLWELETGAINNSRRICKVDQVDELNKPLNDLKLFENDIKQAEETCKTDQECVDQSIKVITNKIDTLWPIFETKPGDITNSTMTCYVDLYSTHMVMRIDQAKQNILKCVKN